jgi:hypothetical protein
MEKSYDLYILMLVTGIMPQQFFKINYIFIGCNGGGQHTPFCKNPRL